VNHSRVWSLLEIMNKLQAEQIGGVLVLLQLLQSGADCGRDMVGAGLPLSPENLTRFGAVLKSAEPLFKEIGLAKSCHQVQLAKGSLAYFSNQNVSSFAAEIKRIIETIITELGETKFLFVSNDRSEYFQNENLLGERVLQRFPLAKDDIIAAGNCLCAECHTAAIFHLMRVFEFALRAFCKELGLARMADFDKATGKFKYTPANFNVWEKQLNQLPNRVQKRLNRLRSGTRKQQLQEYYNSALEDIKFVKDAWRNHVMHGRKIFQRGEAHDLLLRTKGMMERMANGKK